MFPDDLLVAGTTADDAIKAVGSCVFGRRKNVMLVAIADAIALFVVGALLLMCSRHMLFFIKTKAVYFQGKKVTRADEPSAWWLIVISYAICMVIMANFLVVTILSFGKVVPD